MDTDVSAKPAVPVSPPLDRSRRDRRLIAIWLWFVCALVFAIIIVGGATRLTDSGLSITEWLPLLGAIPPLSEADWLIAFAKYKEIPEYQEINKGMSLEAFKFIYWWEWAHRFLGRFIGVAFAVPLIWLWLAGRIEPWLKPRLIVILILGGLQGAVGWWMVASGLVDRVDVSQYRLAAHLILACVILVYMAWVASGLVNGTGASAAEPSARWWAGALIAVVMLQIYSGALVAGLDAGLTYNTWPLMDGDWVPGGMYAREPGWLNLFENITTVQFNHRVLAYAVLAVSAIHAIALALGRPPRSGAGSAVVVFALALGQAVLGIATLLASVPLSLALFHQGGAIVVLLAAVVHLRRLTGPYRQVGRPV